MNGFGPAYLPEPVRKWMTRVSATFFDEAGWQKHDEGYDRGHPSRWVCDREFFYAMWRDANRHPMGFVKAIAYPFAMLTWLVIRLGGWTQYDPYQLSA